MKIRNRKREGFSDNVWKLLISPLKIASQRLGEPYCWSGWAGFLSSRLPCPDNTFLPFDRGCLH